MMPMMGVAYKTLELEDPTWCLKTKRRLNVNMLFLGLVSRYVIQFQVFFELVERMY